MREGVRYREPSALKSETLLAVAWTRSAPGVLMLFAVSTFARFALSMYATPRAPTNWFAASEPVDLVASSRIWLMLVEPMSTFKALPRAPSMPNILATKEKPLMGFSCWLAGRSLRGIARDTVLALTSENAFTTTSSIARTLALSPTIALVVLNTKLPATNTPVVGSTFHTLGSLPVA